MCGLHALRNERKINEQVSNSLSKLVAWDALHYLIIWILPNRGHGCETPKTAKRNSVKDLVGAMLLCLIEADAALVAESKDQVLDEYSPP